MTDVADCSSTRNLELIDLSTPRMKCIGGQWLVKLFDYIHDNPSIVVNGFQAAHIPQLIDFGKPVFEAVEEDEVGSTDDSGSEDDAYDSSSDDED